MAFVRRYRNSDEEAVVHVFRETAAPDLRASSDPAVLHIGSFLWCRNYLYLTTDWCFVLDDGSGKAVGYVICAPDTHNFVKRYRDQFWPVIAKHGISNSRKARIEDQISKPRNVDLATEFTKLVFNPEHMLQSDYPHLVQKYPAHLHIDVLPSHQSFGWGERMIARLLQELKAADIPGVHLGMVAENRRAGRFYDRIGFERFSEMNDGGLGRKENSVYRVKKT